MAQLTFQPTFDSLSQAGCPDWFRDAKFGIWSHWGPQSVPMFGDWYARKMYIEGTPPYEYHLRHYGHPSKFGYKDLCALWKAEQFDPEDLMARYHKAGARYFVAQAMHHDHFFNYPSKLNRMNSTQVGPMRDICGLWKAAAKKYDLPFGLTEHLGASFSWWRVNKGCDEYGPYKGVPYDGNDPAWRDFYFDNFAHGLENKMRARPWYTDDAAFRAYWLNVMKEVIDLYAPDLLYSDGALPFGGNEGDTAGLQEPGDPIYQCGLEAVAHLYNTSMAKHGQNRAVYTQKDRRKGIYRVGVLDLEKSQLPDISPDPWQTDTCLGNWFYDVQKPYKRPGHIIEMLVDIIAKNGTMLLNILQRPDGTVDDEAGFVLNELAKWFPVCAQGVYGTRPWKLSGEGFVRVAIEGFCEDETEWNNADFRFTAAKDGSVVYAFMMAPPKGGTVVLRSFDEGETVRDVRLLGAGKVAFEHRFGVLTVQLPERFPTEHTNCLAICLA